MCRCGLVIFHCKVENTKAVKIVDNKSHIKYKWPKDAIKIRQKLSDWIKGEDSTIVCLQETQLKIQIG